MLTILFYELVELVIMLLKTTECDFFFHQRSVRESCERIGSFLHEVCKAEEETGRCCNVSDSMTYLHSVHEMNMILN